MGSQTFGRVRPAVAGLAVILILVGCAGGAATLPSVGGPEAPSGGAVDGRAGTVPEAVPPDYGAPLPAATAAPDQTVTGGGAGSNAAFRDDAKVVKTGSLSLEVATLDETLKRARAAIVGLGGYVSGSDESNDGDRTQATIVYRIPADRWDDALDALRGLATKVVGEQTNAVEVTGQVLDMDARIRNLKTTESALQAIMGKATKISDILDVQQQLTVVREQIEQLSTARSHLEDQAAFGTLSVYFTVPVPAIAETTKGWDPAAEVDRAIASLVGVLQGVASFGIWLLIVGLPILLVIGILASVALALLRRVRGDRGIGTGILPPSAPAGPAAPAAPEA